MLGEGALWHAPTRSVYFVDIKGKRVHRCAFDGSERRSWDAPGQVGFALPIEGGGLVCGVQGGLYRLDEASGAFTRLLPVEAQQPGNRLNDGYADAGGALWFGSMDDAQAAPSGALYRLGRDGLKRMDEGYIITNGPAASPDGTTLYHTDTLAKRTWAFDLAPDGSLKEKRLFAEFSGHGHPDGMAVDSEGHVWIALFGGARIDRFRPDGSLAGSVAFPCSNITKLAFGGDDLRTAYVTTARKGLTPAQLAEQPLAGNLFTFRVAVPGLPQHHVSKEVFA
ncbi:SMP-30/gluconolactonase/LRE family protein [Massilia niabensis]|uniref:SMP-30/gluconolactonase/LRE family protein n=1 Tax=Massilia niabensis TaxID=544910 RepID=A0ABW0LE61_9BURK